MVRIAPVTPICDEAPVQSSSAVVKVSHKSEILRFRVGWPLDASEVLATVSEAFRVAGHAGDHAHTSEDSLPVFLYHGDQGRLLELGSANAVDFTERHTNPVHPIRLVTVARHASVRNECLTELTSQGASSVSNETDLITTPSQKNPGPVISTGARNITDDEKSETSVIACKNGQGETPSSLQSSLGREFLAAATTTSLASSSARVPSRTDHEPIAAQKAAKVLSDMPQAARKAADALGDALEGAFEKFSRALPTPWLLPVNSELQNALLASAELQEAREKSAAESRARLATVLDKYQVKLRPVDADGNCQFRALSVQLCGDEAQHAALRKRVTQHLRDRRERYEGYVLGQFDEYLERMERDGEWGDNVTLQAASDVLSRNILVLTDRSGTSELLELNPEIASEEEQHQPLCLAFLTEVHYDAVIM